MENDLGFSRQDPDERPKKRVKIVLALVGSSGWTLLEENPLFIFVQMEPRCIRFMARDIQIDLFNYHFCY